MSTRRTCALTATIGVPNINGWGVEPVVGADWDKAEETGQQVDIRVDVYQVGLPIPLSFVVTVSNTTSSRLTVNGAPTGIGDLILKDTVATPAGFTNAVAGWRSGGTRNARQKGLADALIAAGIIGAGLGGVTS
jgi:hypothetical protein